MQGYRRVASGFDNAGGLYLTWAAEAYDNYKKEADLKRVPIQPLTEMKLEVLQDLLGPDSRLSDLQKAYLSGRTGQPISARPVQLRPQPGAVMETNSPAVTNASAKTP